MKTLFLSIIIALSPQKSDRVESTVTPFEFKMGEPVEWSFQVSTHDSSQVIWPDFKDTTSVGWHIITEGAIDTSLEGNQRLLSQTVVITRFDTTMQELLGVPFEIDGDTVYSEAHILSLIPTVLSGDDYHGLKPIEEAPFNWGRFFFWFSLFSGVGISGLLIYYHLLKKNTISTESEDYHPMLSPWEKAFRRLEKLEMSLSPQMNQKVFYGTLTRIFKEYMEEVTHYPAAESTSSELMIYLSKVKITVDLYNRLEKMLQEADWVKFAKGQLEEGSHSSHIKTIREFIQSVRPQPKEIEEHVS